MSRRRTEMGCSRGGMPGRKRTNLSFPKWTQPQLRGQLASAAAKLSPPDSPNPQDSGSVPSVGQVASKIHTPTKVNGVAEFGIDVRRPGMLFAAVSQSPVFGGQVKSYDEAAAKAVKGVEAVVPIPNGVAVVADSTWHAKQGLEALKPQFEGGDSTGLDSAKVNAKLRTALDGMGKAEVTAEKVLDVEYEMPYLYHATMEPMNCTAHVTSDSCEVWVPTQNQTDTLKAVMEVTGFLRRSNPDPHHAAGWRPSGVGANGILSPRQ